MNAAGWVVKPEISSPELLRLHGLGKVYTSGRPGARVHTIAVDAVDLHVSEGETLGLVGESGCGKSTLGRMIMRLTTPTKGRIVVGGVDITNFSGRKLRPFRRQVQMVFQDPFATLDPRFTIAQIVTEPLIINNVGTRAGRLNRARELMDMVGMSQSYLMRRPAEMSGGQRQRVGIARALALQPRLLVLDEAVSALDVSVQAQIINLLQDLQQELGLSYVAISHDLSVVRQLAHRVAVMYLGRVVEVGDAHDVYNKPRHPYTSALLSAIPLPDPKLRDDSRRRILSGDVPNPADPPSGCTFRTRCWKAEEVCAQARPPLVAVDESNSGMPVEVACWFPE